MPLPLWYSKGLIKNTEPKLIRLSAELKEEITKAAEQKGISESDLIRIAREKETQSILKGDIRPQAKKVKCDIQKKKVEPKADIHNTKPNIQSTTGSSFNEFKGRFQKNPYTQY